MRFNIFNKKQSQYNLTVEEEKNCRRKENQLGHDQHQQQFPSETNFYLPESVRTTNSMYFSLWLLVFVIGVLLLTLSTNLHLPAKLSSGHRFIEANCESCHRVDTTSMAATLSKAFLPKPHNKQDPLCIDCHQFNKHKLSAHNISSTELEQLTMEAKQNKIRSGLFIATLAKKVLPDHKELSCISCHREHQGLNHDLTAINNNNCQFCHQSTFLHFKDHPEFTDFPNAPSAHIHFDHQAHIKKNFDKEENLKQFKPENCNDCHQPDGNGQLMLLGDFEQVCSNCHLGQILGDSQTAEKGIAVFNIMGMDIETLNNKGFITGTWPEDSDSTLSAFMRLLLSTDQKAVQAMTVLNKTDTLDLRQASPAQLQAATDLIWATKILFSTLQQQGQQALKTRLEAILKMELPAQQFAELSSLLSPDLFNAAIKDWFPLLNKEIDFYQQADFSAIANLLDIKQKAIKPEAKTIESDNDDLLFEEDDLLLAEEDFSEQQSSGTTKTDSKTLSAEQWVSSGGWYRSYDSLYYRPGSHADAFLKSWLNLTFKSDTTELKAIFKSIAKPKAQGMCLKCHQLTNTSISWQAKQPEKNSQPFTYFAHNRHLATTEIKNCATCHRFEQPPDSIKQEKTLKPDFKPINKSQCEDCHSDVGVASENCMTCHNYHIGEIKLKMEQTGLSVYTPNESPVSQINTM